MDAQADARDCRLTSMYLGELWLLWCVVGTTACAKPMWIARVLCVCMCVYVCMRACVCLGVLRRACQLLLVVWLSYGGVIGCFVHLLYP